MAKRSYDHLSREDLIALLKKRDTERKLGLVWERDEIEHENALNSDFVAMDFVPELSVGEGPHRNLIIEGDNFDALRYLSIAYKGRVKCIYIDPPYNTGNKDFIYNDRFVEQRRWIPAFEVVGIHLLSIRACKGPPERRWRHHGLDQ